MLKKEDKKSKDARPSISEVQVVEEQVRERVHSVLHIPGHGDWSKARCCGGLTYIVLAVFVMVLGLIEIVVSLLGATTERLYDTPQSGRMIAMILLAVVALVTIGILIYGVIGVKDKHTKPLHTATIVLLILAIIQALIAGIAVYVTELDEMGISRSLAESFYRSKDGDLKQMQLWDATQQGLECCGLYNPEDYRDPYGPYNFPPDVPASCCPLYNSPNTTNDKIREMCKANNSYYKSGCKVLVIEGVKGAAVAVMAVTFLLLVAEIIIAILGAILSRKRKEEKHEHIEFSPTPKPSDVA